MAQRPYVQNGSVIKTSYCSSQGTEFGPHHLCQVAHNACNSGQGDLMPLGSAGH